MIYKQDDKSYLAEVVNLIQEYITELHRDLTFQNLQQELNDLSSQYLPPYGHLMIAVKDHQVIRCVALHKHSDIRCEMKRLFVKKEYRHNNIAHGLIQRILDVAVEDGYKEMVLDTIQPLQSAIQLYHQFGFYEISAYYNNPMDDVIYMKKEL
ncbi:GNAT family N-acetyltransferase [Massilimicrobiota timonensis]|uniref:GNAT family N-acetyltransferase n=1 Tax=Massilimicrobiota timonensis TaxID=1776392 RepID=UPI001DFF6518|nr:GNAT family N-acetyltransferase [Massilimicrobiota timonensis]MBM6965965.1 GNAT family N-acetyltransferase [Massilimicrobiota timonensis]